MTKENYRKIAQANFLVIFSSLIYVLFWFFINGLIVYFGFFPLLFYTFLALIGSFALVIAIFPRWHHIPTKYYLRNDFFDNCAKQYTTQNTSDIYNFLLDAQANASIYKKKKSVYISLGFPFLMSMKSSEIQSIIAHEVAHHIYKDTDIGRKLNDLDARIQRIGKLYSSRLLSAVIIPFRPIFILLFKYIMAVSRQNEFQADQFSITNFGSENFITSLLKLDYISDQWNFFKFYWLNIIFDSGRHFDIEELYGIYCNNLERVTITLSELPKNNYGEFDTHPTIYDRVTCVEHNFSQVALDFSPSLKLNDLQQINDIFYNEQHESVLYGNFADNYNHIATILLDKYYSVLMDLTWKGLQDIKFNFGDFAYKVYEIRKIENYDYEKLLFGFIVSYIIYRKTKYPLKVGKLFTPIIHLNNKDIELGAIINLLFFDDAKTYCEMLKEINIDINENILSSKLVVV